MREEVEPTVEATPGDVTGKEEETHPAYGLIGAYRMGHGGGGAVLFDSDVQHQHTVVLRVQRAKRKRTLKHDWIFAAGHREIIEVEMSEAQWASFVSSMNVGDGVACTIRYLDGEEVPGFPYAPRLALSMAETGRAAHAAYDHILADLDALEKVEAAGTAKEKKEALRRLRSTIRNAAPNVEFAGKMLAEQTENVVQKARSDIESFVSHKARQLGLDPGQVMELDSVTLALTPGGDGDDPAVDAEVVDDRLDNLSQ